MGDLPADYDAWKLRAPEDDRPARNHGMECPDCRGECNGCERCGDEGQVECDGCQLCERDYDE